MFAIRGWRQGHKSILVPTQRSFFSPRAMATSSTSPSRVSPYSTGSPNPSSPPKRVGTHNDSFHCDEAFGCFMIRLTNKFAGAEIVRTRDPKILDTLDAVLDFGGAYDPD